jgi:enamine deaminase RidA (YjgF/YER057c/UK114 family)
MLSSVTCPKEASQQSPVVRTQQVLSLQPQPGEDLIGLCRRLAQALEAAHATPLHLQVFGQTGVSPIVREALRTFCGRVDYPVTWVEGFACHHYPVAGLQVHLFNGQVERLEDSGRIVGSVFTAGGARQCWVGGLGGDDASLTRPEQTRRTLERLQAILAQAGFELADVIRTWFFLEDILAWYNDFNRARTQVYSGLKFRTGSLPASTGVGAKNPAGSALALSALAFRSLTPEVQAREIASPLQCPAPAYGSSFSRAMELPTDTGHCLHISGTASIAPGGKTLWVGDTRRQVELTMEVVAAILSSRGYSFNQLTRATAYFRHAREAGIFAEWLAAHQLTHLPIISTQCDVCRDDLWFELEAEAEKN